MQSEETQSLFTFGGQKNEMDRACGTNGVQERCIQGFGWRARRKENNWKTESFDRIILKMNRAKSGMRRRGLD
jgi:hypothetical protein